MTFFARRALVLAIAALTTFLLFASQARSEGFSKPIAVILPYPPGSGPDTAARALAQALSPEVGVPVIVENKPSADGLAAATEFKTAQPNVALKLLFWSSSRAALKGIASVPLSALASGVPAQAGQIVYFGILAPNGTPQAIVDSLRAALARSIPKISAQLEGARLAPFDIPAMDFAELVKGGSYVPKSQPAPTQVIAVAPPPSKVNSDSQRAQQSSRRAALIIGNSDYRFAPRLFNPPNDAKALADALKATGFQTVLVKGNLTRDQTITALQEFAAIADNSDWAVIYYSGHGLGFNGTNYIIPVDAHLLVDRDVDLEAVDANNILRSIQGARKLQLLILDACRENPFLSQMRRTATTRSIGRGLARVEPVSNTLVVFSAKDGEVALDGDGANSPFASALVNRIATPNLEVRRLFDLVRDDVLTSTNRSQQPFTYGSLSGSEDFYFMVK